ncbi:biotin-dependent carboxyltransferase family protein [Chitinibacter sp. FCG-7]|uniref:Biotin-dependent carboxyltransferase family protein n=1 Tax=Chitinibacter mangrovi TaxID=3153927 RepID=A0AAU7FCJ0_9NEIS
MTKMKSAPPLILRVEKAGLQSTVQDLGRPQGASWGLPVGGAADALALQVANLLLGNPHDAAALEITLGGFRAQFAHTSSFALSGADCEARLDGRRLLPNAVYRGLKGQILSLGAPQQGARSYLALPGGIDVPELWGSSSTLLAAALGGLAGRALKKGDQLCAGLRDHARPALAISMPERGHLLRFIAGPQWAQLGSEGQKRFAQQSWKIDIQSNRMALKLNAGLLQMEIPIEIASHAVLAGTVQLPRGGQPMILLCDAQVTGGYPVIAQIIQADLWRLGQLRAGDTVALQQVDQPAALAALAQQQAWLQRIEVTIARQCR